MGRRTIHNTTSRRKTNGQISCPWKLLGREDILNLTMWKVTYKTLVSHGYNGSATAKMPVSCLCVANEFDKWLRRVKNNTHRPVDTAKFYSSSHWRSKSSLGLHSHSELISHWSYWIFQRVGGQRAANAQWKCSNPSDVSRFMNPFDSCIFFSCGLPAKEIPSLWFPAMKWLAVPWQIKLLAYNPPLFSYPKVSSLFSIMGNGCLPKGQLMISGACHATNK